MLGAVMFGHADPAGDRRDHRAGRELPPRSRLDSGRSADHGELEASAKREPSSADLRDAYREPREAGAPATSRAVEGQALGGCSAAKTPARRRCRASSSRTLEADVVRGAILDDRPRIDGRDTKTVRPIVGRGRRAAARPRLGAVHPRRDPGAGRGHARHRPGRADRSTRSRASTASTSCCTTTSRPTRSARPAAWARRAAARSATASWPGARSIRCCRRKEIPLHDPRRLRDHRVATARRRWRRSAAPRWR